MIASICPSDGEYMFAFVSHVGMNDRIPQDGTHEDLRIPQRKAVGPRVVGIAEADRRL